MGYGWAIFEGLLVTGSLCLLGQLHVGSYALLSTLSIRFGYKLKQSIDSKPRFNVAGEFESNETSDRGRSLGCCLHPNASPRERNNDCCVHCTPGTENVEENHARNEQMTMSSNSLPLVTVPATSFNKENGVMWATSDHMDLPMKPYHSRPAIRLRHL